MTTSRRSLALAAVLCIALLTGCAGTAAGGAAPASDGGPAAVPPALSALPAGEVIAQGTVIDDAGAVQLCLGGVNESLPPQCAGVPLVGWNWADTSGSEAAGQTRWGAYAVYGTYDGRSITVTRPPILLALYDAVAPDDPTGGEPGPGDDARLSEVQGDIHTELGDAALSSWPQNGRLWVQVVWDDGTLQERMDDRHGDDLVVIRSSLRETSP